MRLLSLYTGSLCTYTTRIVNLFEVVKFVRFKAYGTDLINNAASLIGGAKFTPVWQQLQ
jgi:hypothetical protein